MKTINDSELQKLSCVKWTTPKERSFMQAVFVAASAAGAASVDFVNEGEVIGAQMLTTDRMGAAIDDCFACQDMWINFTGQCGTRIGSIYVINQKTWHILELVCDWEIDPWTDALMETIEAQFPEPE